MEWVRVIALMVSILLILGVCAFVYMHRAVCGDPLREWMLEEGLWLPGVSWAVLSPPKEVCLALCPASLILLWFLARRFRDPSVSAIISLSVSVFFLFMLSVYLCGYLMPMNAWMHVCKGIAAEGPAEWKGTAAEAPAELTPAGARDFWADFFDDSNYFTGPPLTEEMIAEAEAALGYRLPESYLRLIRVKNGGSPKRQAYPTGKTGWGENHFQVVGILGIGGKWGIVGEYGSRHWIREWGYPDVGIVVGETPSAGHDTIMLDYSECGPEGEPRVIHVETETADAPEVQVLAPDFETFLRGLVDHRPFDEETHRAIQDLKKQSPGMR